MNTILESLPLLTKAALLVPAALIFSYLAFHEVFLPLVEFQEKYEKYARVPRKTRRDKIQFWVLGRLPATPASEWHADRDAA